MGLGPTSWPHGWRRVLLSGLTSGPGPCSKPRPRGGGRPHPPPFPPKQRPGVDTHAACDGTQRIRVTTCLPLHATTPHTPAGTHAREKNLRRVSAGAKKTSRRCRRVSAGVAKVFGGCRRVSHAGGCFAGHKEVCVPKRGLKCPAPSINFILFPRKIFLMWVGRWVGRGWVHLPGAPSIQMNAAPSITMLYHSLL